MDRAVLKSIILNPFLSISMSNKCPSVFMVLSLLNSEILTLTIAGLPKLFLLNVFIALKRTHFDCLFTVYTDVYFQ